MYSGPCQNETGSDGIGDTTYVIDENNWDNYPLMEPWTALPTTTVLSPTNGSTILNGSIHLVATIFDKEGVDVAWWAIEGIMIGTRAFHGAKNGTYDSAITGLKNGSVLSGAYFVFDNGTIIKGNPLQFSVTIVYGQQYCVTVFANDTSNNIASKKVYVTMPILGDVNGDGIVNIQDVVLCALAFGSRPGDSNWNPIVDLNQDGIIDIVDIVMIAIHFGETV